MSILVASDDYIAAKHNFETIKTIVHRRILNTFAIFFIFSIYFKIFKVIEYENIRFLHYTFYEKILESNLKSLKFHFDSIFLGNFTVNIFSEVKVINVA